MVIAARRSPIGEAGGVLRNVAVDRLAAAVLRAVLDDGERITASGSSGAVDEVRSVSGGGEGGRAACEAAGTSLGWVAGEARGMSAGGMSERVAGEARDASAGGDVGRVSAGGEAATPENARRSGPGADRRAAADGPAEASGAGAVDRRFAIPLDDVVLGNVLGPGGNTARVASLLAGLGHDVPGMTVDRQCASGLSAITTAAALIRAGAGDWYLAGGAESPSTAPWRAWRPRSAAEPPRFYARAPFAPPEIGDPEMGPAADLVAAEAGISRQRQDAFAARSHARAVAAQAEGRFDAEVVDVDGITTDQRPRPNFTPERLARFRPAFTADGTATAANSCGISDGAAAVLMTTEANRRRLGVPGLRLAGWQTSGVDPNRLGLGAVPAMRALLAGHAPEVVEFNEAFAGQALACLDAAGVDDRIASPDGGAIALGHPWGASGAVLVVRLFSRMVRAGGPRTGLAALSSGGGLGVATVWERVD
ncbi:acetyl-CoA acetyltransferase [Saccharopolyspora erythraea NRRL 2338]|uniref:Acetyl-CoA acetyltransferase n=1 Tax=Saccharopolyspora erythraea (strain ATCC 11635 / DSM 40517 / JCM 4748 / NBRC 13426 / NCIMB 8594 / NRRL 2338) TaxID=405948 RepID=A4F8Z3_SACEN|nr:acetyl-CoA acetyltransferase [Saccharopolyspora erythraea NRRL 2338]